MISWLQTFMVSKIIWLVYILLIRVINLIEINMDFVVIVIMCSIFAIYMRIIFDYLFIFFTYLTKRCDSKLYSSTKGKCDDDAKCMWLVFATILWRVTMATRLYWRFFFSSFCSFLSVCFLLFHLSDIRCFNCLLHSPP